jgi:hypothetical protein
MRQRRPRTAHIDFATRYRERKKLLRPQYVGFFITVLLTGCSSSTDTPQLTYTPPSPPTQPALIEGLRKAVPEEKLTAPIEISALRRVEFGGFGSYFVCMREANPTSERHFVYSVFYDNEEYKGARQSVIMEHCEAEAFSQIDTTPPPSPTPTPKSAGRKGRTN